MILNIEADHLDFFKDLADIQASFRKFAQLTPVDGKIIANGDDPNVAAALAGMNYLTFGIDGRMMYMAVIIPKTGAALMSCAKNRYMLISSCLSMVGTMQ